VLRRFDEARALLDGLLCCAALAIGWLQALPFDTPFTMSKQDCNTESAGCKHRSAYGQDRRRWLQCAQRRLDRLSYLKILPNAYICRPHHA
jgi:hypothetical protein